MVTTKQKETKSSTMPALLPWLIWGLAALFYAYEFSLQVSFGVIGSELMHVFHINAATLGNLGAFYFYAYASMQIPAGVFLDTLGPRRLLTAASAICVIGALIFSGAHALWTAQLGRLLIGFGSAFAAIGTFKLATTWFPLERFSLLTGLTLMIGMLGAVSAGSPLALLVDHVGWRHSMLIFAIIGACISLLIWTFVRDTPHQFNNKKSREYIPQTNIIKSLLYIFKQKQSWLVAAYGGLMFAPTTAFGALWGVPFLMSHYGFSRPVAAGAVSMVFIGWAVGSPLFGGISDYIRKRKPTMYIGSLLALICMLIIIYAHIHLILLYSVLFLFGLFSAGFLPSFSIIREINPPNTNATALGFMNMLNMIGGAALQPLIGWILDRYWQGAMLHHVRYFSAHAYHIALAALPIVIGIAFLLVPFIKETSCQQLTMEDLEL